MKLISQILFVLIPIFASKIYCQSSPEELGKSLMNCFQGDRISQIKKHFPTADQLLRYAKKHNMDLNDDKISALKVNYSNQIIELNSKFIYIQKDGIDKGIEWKMIQTDSIRTSKMKSPNATIENDSIEINRVEIDFHYMTNNYRMVLENTIEIAGRWYIDNKIYFREIIEE
jgi:hypothetical protein